MILVVSLMRRQGTTGVQTHMRAFAQQLARTGHACEVVTPFDGPPWLLYPLLALRRLIEKISPAAGVWLYRSGHALLLRLALRRALLRHPDSVIYAQCPVSADVALRSRTLAQQTITMVVHFNLSQADEWVDKGAVRADGRLYRAMRRFESDVLPRVDALVFVSAFAERMLLQRMPALAVVRREVIPNFLVDPGEPSPLSRATSDLIAIGTLEPRKNQRYLLDIVAAARDAGRCLTLTIAGDGPDRTTLVEWVQTLGITDRVTFAGYVKDAARLFASHRACVHVATMENFSVTLVEACAAGRAVLAAATGGTAEAFDDGVEGRALPLNDARRAAQIIGEALDAQNELERMGTAARRRFLASYEAAAVVDRLHRFIAGGSYVVQPIVESPA